MDRLFTLLSQFGVCASLFYNGNLCGMASYDGADQRGHIHLLRAGSVTLQGVDRKDLLLTQPSLIFLPRPLWLFEDAERFSQSVASTG
ncbi:hypothetical protein ASC74_28860 [Pseudomonas sp. Root329]|nr:cupin domain-containing protein [Pseudomonas sp. Root329]KQV13584.1 hypothetical protein ASC74_28860 [Pseudomonas sp. Root329]